MDIIDIGTLQEIIKSKDFINDLKKLSSWAANVKQETPIVQILAKMLSERGYVIALEWDKKNKHDIMTNNNTII